MEHRRWRKQSPASVSGTSNLSLDRTWVRNWPRNSPAHICSIGVAVSSRSSDPSCPAFDMAVDNTLVLNFAGLVIELLVYGQLLCFVTAYGRVLT
jgi:hypothetical protein